jgi:mycothiol synthase
VQPKALKLTIFNPKEANRVTWHSLNTFLNKIQAEALPDHPTISVDETKLIWESIPPVIERDAWIVQREGSAPQIVALGYVDFMHTEENQHVAQAQISVLPEMRRMGLGTQLLAKITNRAQQNGRRLLIGEANENIPAGIAFIERLGAQIGLRIHIHRLEIANLDQHLLNDWQALAHQKAIGFELGLWVGPYPEDQLPAMAAIKHAINQQPHDGLEIEDVNWTPEILRQIDETLVQRGIERWTIYVRESASGNLAGFTEVTWQPNNPEIIQQGDTAVLEEYRNRGLGRWLKSAMLVKIIHEKPMVKFVRTVNADSNAPMRRINEELGFKPYRASSVCQVEIEQINQYLAQRNQTPNGGPSGLLDLIVPVQQIKMSA